MLRNAEQSAEMRSSMFESKYAPLQVHLKNLSSSSWKTSFDKIEEILGFTLPHSAYTYSAWWGNHVQNSRHTKAWMDIGWEVHDLDIHAQTLTFQRVS